MAEETKNSGKNNQGNNKGSNTNNPKPEGLGYNRVNEGFNKAQVPDTKKAMPIDALPTAPKPKK